MIVRANNNSTSEVASCRRGIIKGIGTFFSCVLRGDRGFNVGERRVYLSVNVKFNGSCRSGLALVGGVGQLGERSIVLLATLSGGHMVGTTSRSSTRGYLFKAVTTSATTIFNKASVVHIRRIGRSGVTTSVTSTIFEK